MSRIVFIGSGNLATHLSMTLQRHGHSIEQIYSHTLEHAKELAGELHCDATDDLASVITDADCYILAVKDSAMREVATRLCPSRQDALFIHTAGSMPLSVFEGIARHYGVLWPIQSFTKSRPVDFRNTPCIIEGADKQSLAYIRDIASTISGTVIEADSTKRKKLHLAAVLSSNLANHCYRLAERIIEEPDSDNRSMADDGITLSLFAPLILETARKVSEMSPREAQTGPMVRYDRNVMDMQEALIHDERTRKIYQLMAESIHCDY